MRNISHKLAAAAIITLAGTIPASAATVTITQTLDNANAADTYLDGYKNNHDLNYGTESMLYVRDPYQTSKGQNWKMRGLIHFDSPTLPADAIVSQAILSLKLSEASSNVGVTDAEVGIFQMLVPWQEEEATWNSTSTGISWAAPGMEAGTDYNTTAESIAIVELTDIGNWQAWDVTSLVNRWLSGTSSNDGLAVLLYNGSDDDNVSLRFYSTEASENNLPRLTITYEMVPEPSGMLMLLSAGGALLSKRSRRA